MEFNMEENKNNQEKKSTEELEQEKQYNEYESEADGVEFKKTKGEIKTVIDDAKKNLESIRFKKFIESKGLSAEEYKGSEDLKDGKLSKEFSEYKLDKDDPDVLKCFNDAKGKLISITASRDDKINELYGNKEGKEISEQKGKVQQLLDDVDNKIKELQNKEGNEEEIKKLEEIKQKIGNKEQKSGLFKKLDEASQKQMSVRRIALEDFSLAMDEKVNGGKEMVLNDSKIKKTIGELDKDGQLIARSINEVSKDNDLEKEQEDGEKIEENKENQDNQEKVAVSHKGGTTVPKDVEKVAQQMAGQQGFASQPNGIAGFGDNVEQKMNLESDYLSMLGYNSDNVLDFENSSELLGKFANNFSDKARVEMLNDPECKAVILKALSVTGKNLSPKKAKTFNDTRDKLLRLAKGPMMEMALRDMGIENPENVKKEFNKLNKEYNNKIKELEDNLNKKDLTPEAKEKLEKQKAELDAKYESIRNVADFQKSTNNIKTIRSRIISFKDAIMNKDSYTQTVKTIGDGVEGYFFDKKEDWPYKADKIESKSTESLEKIAEDNREDKSQKAKERNLDL